MIGRVIWRSGDVEMTAILGDDGRWTCDDPVIEYDLNTDLSCDDYSPADGQRGYRQMHKAAERYDGRVEAPEIGPGPPGLVY